MNSTKVVTGKVRFSYCQVWTPKAMDEGGKEKYSVSILIKKSDTETIAKIENAIKAAIEAGKAKLTNPRTGQLFPKETMRGLKLRDGDIEKDGDPAYEGCYFINANSNNKPQIVDRDCNAILDQSEFYSGCYGRASINFFAYNTAGGKGVACGLNCLQKLSDGEPLGGSSNASADFGGYNKWQDDDLM